MRPERVCSVSDVAPGQARRFALGGLSLAVVRIDDDWYAISDTCSHQKVSLSEGDVLVESREIECWKHGSCFSLESGEPSSLPATRPIAVYEVVLDGDDVMVVAP